MWVTEKVMMEEEKREEAERMASKAISAATEQREAALQVRSPKT